MAKPWYSKSHLLIEKVSSTTFIIIPQIHSDLNVSGRGTKVFFPKTEVQEAWKVDPLTMSNPVLMPWSTSLDHGSTRSSSALLIFAFSNGRFKCFACVILVTRGVKRHSFAWQWKHHDVYT